MAQMNSLGYILDNPVPGNGSFQPQMAAPFPQIPLYSFHDPHGRSTADMIEELQAKLQQRLGPEYMATRDGPGGRPLRYIEGWRLINVANEVFGYNGWNTNIVRVDMDFLEQHKTKETWSAGCSAIVRVTLRDGTYHEDLGFGSMENNRSKGQLIEKVKKEAVTDAVKRALRFFGNAMGNCMSDKSYTDQVWRMKKNLKTDEIELGDLHRHPNYAPPSEASTEAPLCAKAQHNCTASLPISTKLDTSAVPKSNYDTSSSKSNAYIQPDQKSIAMNSMKPPSAPKNNISNASSPNNYASPEQKSVLHSPNNNTTSGPSRASNLTAISNRKPPLNTDNSERRVSFHQNQPPAVQNDDEEDEDDKYFGSQDDSFFAAIPECDLGLVRPIEHEEYNDSVTLISTAVTEQSMSNANISTTALKAAGLSGDGIQRLAENLQQQQKSNNTTSNQRRGGGTGMGLRNPTTGGRGGNGPDKKRKVDYKKIIQEGLANSKAAVQPQHNQTSERAGTPSMGAFQFPLGNPDKLGSHIGVKRSAGAMDTHAGNRQPFGQLDVSEGGEVKRLKR